MKVAADFVIDVPIVKTDDLVTRARQMLRDDIFREVFVYDSKKCLAGYIDITDVLRVTATKSNITVEGFLKEINPVLPDASVEEAARVIRENRTDSAPVIDENKQIVGGILLSDIFPIIITRNELHGIVRDLMNKKVVTCSPTDSVQKVHNLILESGFTAFPVIKKNKLVGMISRRDLLKDGRVRSALESGNIVPVEEIMQKKVISITPSEKAGVAAEIMVRFDIGRLPVIEDERLVGIVDRHDILKGLT